MKASAGIRELDRIAKPPEPIPKLVHYWNHETDPADEAGKPDVIESGQDGANDRCISLVSPQPDGDSVDDALPLSQMPVQPE